MSKLILTPNIAGPDDLYEKLIALHDGFTADESLAANAQLILTLVNHIGDPTVVTEAIDLVRQNFRSEGVDA